MVPGTSVFPSNETGQGIFPGINPGIEPPSHKSPALQADSLASEPPGISWLGKLVSMFWWVELYFFSLECNEVSSNEL